MLQMRKSLWKPNPGLLKSDGRIVLGAVLVMVSAIMFAVGGAASKFLSNSIDPAAALLWRNFVSAFGVLLWFAVFGFPSIGSSRVGLNVLRGVVTFAGLWTYFVALAAIPLATAVLLRTAAPVFVPLIAITFYRRNSDRNVWIGAWIGLLGVALVVQPTMAGSSFGTLVGVLSGALGAAGAVLMWQLGDVDTPRTQFVWLTIVLTACSVAMAPWALTMPTNSDWPVIIVMAATTTASQILLVHAFTIAPADKVITWGYLSVVIGAVIGIVVWNEMSNPIALCGMAIIIVGSHLTTRKPRAKNPDYSTR